MRDSICGRYGTKRFFLLYHTLYHDRPVFSGNTVCKVLCAWMSLFHNGRMNSLRCFILSQQVLYLLIQDPRRAKEEVENW
jgi:hypothetical protein